MGERSEERAELARASVCGVFHGQGSETVRYGFGFLPIPPKMGSTRLQVRQSNATRGVKGR
jgi:hypothetical protein